MKGYVIRMKLNGKWYTTKNKNRAITISYLLNEDFMKFTDKRDSETILYGFKTSDKLEDILNIVNKYRN